MSNPVAIVQAGAVQAGSVLADSALARSVPASKRRKLAVTVLCTLMLLALPGPLMSPLLAEPTRYEKQNVEAQALEAFRQILGLWQEELYFELYEAGMESTKKQISLEDFAQRMVELAWVPQGKLNPKFLKAKFRFRTIVYVSARVEYRHKFNPEKTFFKDHTFLLLEEAGTWRIDLVQLVRAPFA